MVISRRILAEILRKTKAEMQARLEPTTRIMSLPKPISEDDGDDTAMTPIDPNGGSSGRGKGGAKGPQDQGEAQGEGERNGEPKP